MTTKSTQEIRDVLLDVRYKLIEKLVYTESNSVRFITREDRTRIKITFFANIDGFIAFPKSARLQKDLSENALKEKKKFNPDIKQALIDALNVKFNAPTTTLHSFYQTAEFNDRAINTSVTILGYSFDKIGVPAASIYVNLEFDFVEEDYEDLWSLISHLNRKIKSLSITQILDEASDKEVSRKESLAVMKSHMTLSALVNSQTINMMQLRDDVEKHIFKGHTVTYDEICQALLNQISFTCVEMRDSEYRKLGDDVASLRATILGRTNAGRALIIVLQSGAKNMLTLISTHDPDSPGQVNFYRNVGAAESTHPILLEGKYGKDYYVKEPKDERNIKQKNDK